MSPARAGSRASGRDLPLWGAFALLALFVASQYGDALRVPFLLDISGIGRKAINLRGSGGRSPPAQASGKACGCVSSVVGCV